MKLPRLRFVALWALLAVAAGVCICVYVCAGGETVAYRASVLEGAEASQLLAEGTVEYWPAFDILAGQGTGKDGAPFWNKGIRLFDEWLLLASIHRDQELRGFALKIRNESKPNGFSWEWFYKVEEGLFQKLQGTGKVRVEVDKGPNYEEIVAVEFLDDITLRYLDDMTMHEPGTDTHGFLIRKGSVLRVAP